METVKANRRVAVGLGLLLVVTLMLGWFVGRFVPGEPQSLHSRPSYYIYPSTSATYIPVSKVEEAAFGSTARVEGLMRGRKYTKTQPCVIASFDGGEERAVFVEEIEVPMFPESYGYDIAFPPFEMKVEGARAVSLNAFAEWYPEFLTLGLVRSRVIVPELSKVVLVDVTATNLSDDRVLQLDHLLLASDAFNQVSPGCLGNGCSISGAAFDVLNDGARIPVGEEESSFSSVAVEPGETRTFTLPYVVGSSFFADVADYEELDLACFSLEIGDYATGTLHRFALA